jgi:hypothetical protein
MVNRNYGLSQTTNAPPLFGQRQMRHQAAVQRGLDTRGQSPRKNKTTPVLLRCRWERVQSTWFKTTIKLWQKTRGALKPAMERDAMVGQTDILPIDDSSQVNLIALPAQCNFWEPTYEILYLFLLHQVS